MGQQIQVVEKPLTIKPDEPLPDPSAVDWASVSKVVFTGDVLSPQMRQLAHYALGVAKKPLEMPSEEMRRRWDGGE